MLDMQDHPADELALIRQEMRRLVAREAMLLDGFISGRLPPLGLQHEVAVRTRIERVFVPERLPEALLLDDDLWQESELPSVVVRERVA